MPPKRDGRPDFKVYDNGTEIAKTVREDVLQITVDDALDEAAVATIKLSDKGGKRSDGSCFAIGNPVKIELGYVGSTAVVFEGEVTGWRGTFARRNHQTLTIIAQDKFHRLRRNRRQKTFTNMKDSDAISQAAQACGLQVEAEATDITQDVICQWNTSDADFLLERARLAGRECLVQGNKLVVRKPKLDAGAAATLKWHEELRSLTLVLSLSSQQADVKVSAWDMKQKAPVTATVTTGKEGSKMGGTVTGTDAAGAIQSGTTWLPKNNATTQQHVDQMAQAAFQARSEKFVEGEGTAEGDPAILKGTVVQVDAIGDYLAGPYYVKRAIHTLLVGGGYTTTFQVKRTAVKKQAPPPQPQQTEPEKLEPKKIALLDPTWIPPGGIVADVVHEPEEMETLARSASPGNRPEIEGEEPPEVRDEEAPRPKVQTIRFKLEDQDGTPLGGKPFELRVGGDTITGTTRADGYVIADVPANIAEGELTFWLEEDRSGDSYTWPLRIADHADKGGST